MFVHKPVDPHITEDDPWCWRMLSLMVAATLAPVVVLEGRPEPRPAAGAECGRARAGVWQCVASCC